MLCLPSSLNSWGSPKFTDVLKKEIEQVDAKLLPLQQGLSAGNYVVGDKFSVIVFDSFEDEGFIHTRAGIFYNSIIAGCSCADDPTPVSELNEYCVVRLDIDKKTAETKIELLPDQE